MWRNHKKQQRRKRDYSAKARSYYDEASKEVDDAKT
jgi:hypothetical protein